LGGLRRRRLAPRKQPRIFPCQPHLEALEDRTVPSTIPNPATLQKAYGIDQIRFGASNVVGNGAGQTIALIVIGADDTSLVSDLKEFDNGPFGPQESGFLGTFGSFDVPRPGAAKPWFAVVEDPNFPPATNYTPAEIARHDLETAEDVEWAHAIATMANILVVETGSIQSGTGYAGTLQKQNPTWKIAVIASSSSHFPSFKPQDYADSSVAYVGITGDTGTSINSQLEGFGPQDIPASTPDVLAVGGTTLSVNADGSYGSETAWGFAGPNRVLTSADATYSPAVSWQAASGGYTGTYEVSTPFGPGLINSATWSTTVQPGDTLGINDSGLEVSATWTAAAGNSAAAQYLISVNGNLVDTATVNQQLAPTGNLEGFRSRTGFRTAAFQELAALSGLQVGDTITVVLQGAKVNGTLVADTIGLGPDDASGGGLSDQPQPSFQAGLVIHNGNTIISSNGRRAYPDVAFDGDYVNSPVIIVNQGFVQEVAGTSLGAPAWAALLAIADQGLATVGHAPLSTAQVLAGLYKLPSWDFHDETTGYSGYLAGPGYDLVTGLGSPVANQLIIGLDRTVAAVKAPLVYEAPEGQGANNIQVIQNGSTLEVLNNSTIVASTPRALTTSIDVIGAQNEANTLNLKFASGTNPLHPPTAPTGLPISFDGGSPGGTLVLEGGRFSREVDFANDAHSGTLYLDGTSITYTDLGPIIDTAPATTLTIADPQGNDVVTVGNDPNSPENGVPTSQVSGNGFAAVDLANQAHVLFDDYSIVGSDTVNRVAPLVHGATFTVQQIANFTDGPATATATVGTFYSFTYTAQGTPAPTFRLLSGSHLPPGLTFSASGVLRGTPTAPGTFTGTVYANNGVSVGAIQGYSITVARAQPIVSVSVSPTEVLLGSGIRLTATAHLADGFHETGTLTFQLYDPNGFKVDTETVLVNGNGNYPAPHGFLPTVKGIYEWLVLYSGDADNDATDGTAKEGVASLAGIGTSPLMIGMRWTFV
jgi:hypothetical protein